MKKKVLLKVYTEVNLGDDLFLKIILDRYPEVDFFLEANSQNVSAFTDYKNLFVYNSNKFKKKGWVYRIKQKIVKMFFPTLFKKKLQASILKDNLKYFKDCDFFVSIGGSIFMEVKEAKVNYDIVYYNIINEYFKDKSVFYIGCNFGPFFTKNYYESYLDIFNKATDVCFRDTVSKDLFKDVLQVRLAPDVVFGLPIKKDISLVKIKKSIGFSIISARNGIDKESYVVKLANIIQNFIRDGYKVFLFSFCEIEGDALIIDEICTIIDKEHLVTKVYYNGDIDDFLESYAKVEKMYCSRFHSMILSMLYNQEICPLVYSEKMINVLEDINYKGLYYPLEEVLNRDLDLFNGNDFMAEAYKIDQLKVDALKQFSVLDNFLH